MTDPAEPATANTWSVEAVSENYGTKEVILGELARLTASPSPRTRHLAMTTSSLSIRRLARRTAPARRLVGSGLNPVPRMKLIQLVVADAVPDGTLPRAHNVCELLDKIAIEVLDIPGFVVNRLLFPYLFNAVELMSETGVHQKPSINA